MRTSSRLAFLALLGIQEDRTHISKLIQETVDQMKPATPPEENNKRRLAQGPQRKNKRR